MEVRIEGDPDGGPPIELDHARFSYAGKFVMSSYGKALGVSDGDVLGAIAFNRDRTDPETVWFRYLTVRADRRGEGIGARLAGTAADRLLGAGATEIRIAVNNPFAFEACYKAGFGYIGEETGLAELVLVRPDGRATERYRAGLRVFGARNGLSDREKEFLDARIDTDPPAVLASIDG